MDGDKKCDCGREAFYVRVTDNVTLLICPGCGEVYIAAEAGELENVDE